MTYVYCPKKSVVAFELVKALNAHRLRRFDGLDFWDKKTRYELKDDDVIICWGASVPEMDGVKVLNGLDKPLSLFDQWNKFVQLGLPVVNIGQGKTMPVPLTPRLEQAVKLINPLYYVSKETFTYEYRIHSFDKRSIRAGVKSPREGFTPCAETVWRPDAGLLHPWVKSFAGGWKVNYDGFQSSPDLRKMAHKAVAALGLTFGAVDIGLRTNGQFCVLKVDSSPRIEGGTINSYARAITRWIKEGGRHDTGGVSSGERLSPEPINIEPEPDVDAEYYDDPIEDDSD